MGEAIVSSEDGSGLMDASPLQLASVVAWRTAGFGARQTKKAVKAVPAVASALRPEIRSRLPKGPIARASENGYSIWSTNSRWSIASIRSLGSGWSILSTLSLGSLASMGSAGSVFSVGSAGSLLSIGSVGSILSIGSAGSVLSIGGVNEKPWRSSVDAVDGIENPTLTVIEHGGTMLGLLALAGAVRSAAS